MSAHPKRNAILLVVVVIIVSAVVLAVVNRDYIAGLILKGGDVSLEGAEAQATPQADMAVDFFAAMRAGDTAAISAIATEQYGAIVQEGGAEFQEMRELALSDLPADTEALRATIASVQTHQKRCSVVFQTASNSWFVILEETEGGWKVAAF